MLVVDTLPCEIILGRHTMSTNNLYQTFMKHLSAHSNSLGEMLSCRCGEVPTEPLSNTQVFSSNTSVSDSCSGKTLPGHIGDSKSRKLLSYGRIVNEPLILSLLLFQKEELLDIEDDTDYVDDYLDKYDRYSNPTIQATEPVTTKSTKITQDTAPVSINKSVMIYQQHTSDQRDINEDSIITDPIERLIIPNADSELLTCNVEGPHIEGTISFKNKVHSLLNKYADRFKRTVGKEPAKVAPLQLEVDLTKWKVNGNRRGPRTQSVLKEQAIREFITQALADGVIEESQAMHVSQVLLTPKPDGTYRFCIDFRALNDASTSNGWPLPRIKEMLARLGLSKPKYFAVMDLTQGYYQCPISVDSRDHTAFTTTIGTYRWKRLPMGLKGAPSYFQAKMANTVLHGLIYQICEIYIDDIIVYGSSEEEFFENLEKVLQRLKEYNISLNPKKTKIGLPKIEYVGHTISGEGISISAEKRQDVLDVPLPVTQQDLKSFLGLVSYYRDHLKNHSTLVQPLHKLIIEYKPRNKLKWTEELTKLFYQVQENVNNAPPLQFLDYNAPVYLHTDASDYGIGANLFQIRDNQELPIAFISRALNATEVKWSTPEKECYAIFYALVKLEYLLRDIKFTLRTDHRNLTFLNESFQQKVKRWKMAVMHFNFDIEHIPGKDNIIADALSRLIKIQPSIRNRSNIDLPHYDSENINVISENILRDVEYYRLDNEAYDKLSKVHSSEEGHVGVEKMLFRLKRAGMTWTTMRMDCKKFIFQCPCCQKMSNIKYPIHTHPFTRASYSPMDRIAIDTIGPLPEDGLGNKYIITIVDSFSRMVELIPTTDTKATTAANAVMQWICRYGIPSQIVCDNGTQYANELITALCHLFAIDQKLIQAYSHEENAIVERANKEVGRHLTAIVFDRKIIHQWSPMLPFVQRIINSQIHQAIGVSPIQLMFGNAVEMDRHLFTDPTVTHQQNTINKMNDIRYQTWMDSMMLRQQTLMEIAMKTQLAGDMFHIGNIPPTEVTEFPINSYVLQNYETDDRRPPTKLNTVLRGPHKVVGRYVRANDGPDVYIVQNLATSKLEDFKVTDLRPFRYDPIRINPHEIATKDINVYLVEAILDHRGSQSKRSNMTFHVKWKGYEETTWETWGGVKDNVILHNYLRAHKLQRLIPSKFT